MEFAPGARAEAALNDEGLVGALASGTIVSASAKSKVVMFRYDELMESEDSTAHLAENVEKTRLRPIPPEEAFELPQEEFKPGLNVDVFVDDLWWQGALRPADDGWVVRGPGGEDDLVPVTPHTEGRSGIGASCFVKGNVRPGLEWKRGAFYWRGTSRKWEAPRGAAGSADAAEEAEEAEGAENEEPEAAAEAAEEAPPKPKSRRKVEGKAAQRARQEQLETEEHGAGAAPGSEDEEEPDSATPAGACGLKRPADIGDKPLCKNCKQPPSADSGYRAHLYTYISPKQRREGPFCSARSPAAPAEQGLASCASLKRCIKGWAEMFEQSSPSFLFYEYDPELDGAPDVDGEDLDAAGRKSVSLRVFVGLKVEKKAKAGAQGAKRLKAAS